MALEVRPRPDISPITYEVGIKGLMGMALQPTWFVSYQPSDGWKPEMALCDCFSHETYTDWPCEHVNAVVEFRRRGDG